MTWVRVRAKDRVKEEYGLNTASPCIKERGGGRDCSVFSHHHYGWYQLL